MGKKIKTASQDLFSTLSLYTCTVNIITNLYSVFFYSLFFNSIFFYSIILYSILFYSIFFYSHILLFYILIFFNLLFYNLLFYILPANAFSSSLLSIIYQNKNFVEKCQNFLKTFKTFLIKEILYFIINNVVFILYNFIKPELGIFESDYRQGSGFGH